MHELQSLVGILNFATSMIAPGHTFLRRLYDLTIGVSNPKFKIKLPRDARADLSVWDLFMQGFNG